MNKMELYDWYVENCTEEEIPLSFKEWEREIYPADRVMQEKISKEAQ